MNNRELYPVISIIVTVYGTEQYFDRCINSILNQSYKNLEIIVVNDGSPGDISNRIKKYLNDSRVIYIDNQKNQGLLKARVCGARRASGDYIAFVDSDDYVSEDFYRVLITKARETDADIVIGKTVWNDNGDCYVYNYHESCFNFTELCDAEIRDAYFLQETQCYSWHTIWNKLYAKKLWDKCMPEYETVDEHIIMTEDIFFSSILFFHAQKVVPVHNEEYFYCSNEIASTNTTSITLQRFEKNMHDIKFVFDKVYAYLFQKGADESILKGFQCGRRHYARMWKNLSDHTFTGDELSIATNIMELFYDGKDIQEGGQEYYFESVKTKWTGGFEFIKSRIKEHQCISFDIFDTLIVRPFYDPTDIFVLLNPVFTRLTNSFISFEKIRKEGEALARAHYGNSFGYEDISIDEIYDYISNHHHIEKSISDEIKEYERSLEKRFCYARTSGKELFEYAKAIGKQVILTSDMYLDSRTIREILLLNGIQGYSQLYLSCEVRKLKYNGGLFEYAVNDSCIKKEQLLHIGDTWRSDIEGSDLCSIHNVFFPKAREVFENRIQGCTTNRCSTIAYEVAGGVRNNARVMQSIGYKCMIALVANTYFDNPYREFNDNSDFNIDPFFVGYYPLAMHLFGIAKWLKQIVANERYKKIAFLARDGYMPMNAFRAIYGDLYNGIDSSDISYIQASRKAVMPILLRDALNFYQMPVEYRAHTPKTISKVLSFAIDNSTDEVELCLQEHGFNLDKPFMSINEFHEYIEFFQENLYSEEKHSKEIEKIKKYYSELDESTIAFDMGYSGRIQSAICEAAGKSIDVAFIHQDYASSVEAKACYGFKIYNYYDFYPQISGLMREHLLSDLSGSCIGFTENADGCVTPNYEETKHTYPDRFVIDTMQKGAMRFITEFLNYFGENLDLLDFSEEDVSLPFEGFLRFPSLEDLHIFSASFFEDLVYGAREDINIEQFAVQNLQALGWPKSVQEELVTPINEINPEEKRITDLIHHSSQIKRGIIWLILNKKFFLEKLKINIQRLIKRERNNTDGL